jgi:uncharacterized cupin superfamily protein
MASAPSVRRISELEPPPLELEPGVVGVLRDGDRAVWRIHETLRKVFQMKDVGTPG